MQELRDIAQHLLRFSPDALIVVDEQGRICFANETIRETFGHDPDALIGLPLETLVPERLRNRHGPLAAGFMRNPANREMGTRSADLFARRADGTEFSAGIRLAPFRIDDRLFVAAAIRDNTERREINEALIAAREEAVHANRAKSRFLATASHDLRQPMQAIRLLNAALQKVVPQPEAAMLLAQQAQAIDNMTRLLNALLDISRLESGTVELQLTEVPLADLFAELRSEFDTLARSRDLTLSVDAPPVMVKTDRALVYQLLQNLLANAIKYTDAGSVAVRWSRDEDGLTLSVEDTGIGIPADKLERVFDEYYQVDTHGTKRVGVGLGLAIVREVARLLGLGVKIDSRVGEGTRARVRIPAYMMVAGPAAVSAAASESAASPAHRPRLFLVEDNDGVRMATELFLKLEGFQVRSAASAAQAQTMAGEIRRGDLLIADFHLDASNTGLDLLLKLRERLGFELPAVILSGDQSSVVRSIKSPVPACSFLSKPVDTSALVQAIDTLSTSEQQHR